jgi:anti-anti-sigma factor
VELHVSTGPDSLEGFGVTISFAEGRGVLGVRGEVDLVTAPELGAVLEAVMDRGYRSVVLDLAELDFMDASGLRVIAHGVQRLGPTGVTIRAPRPQVTRILEITGLAELVRFEPRDPVAGRAEPARLTREQPPAARATLVTVDAGVVGHPRQVMAIPANTDVVDGALRLVVALARATVGGADGVSVSLRRHGRLTTVAATDQTILEMDADQYATGEGPCVDASVEGRRFHAASLDGESRWPAFTPEARKLGINAILSTPLMVEERPVGALNIYSRTPAAFASKDQDLAAIFAGEASVILRDAGANLSEEALAGWLDKALAARAIIAQAQGVIMERDGASAEGAYATLRRLSVESERPLRERAEDVVASTHRPPPAGPGILSEGPPND